MVQENGWLYQVKRKRKKNHLLVRGRLIDQLLSSSTGSSPRAVLVPFDANPGFDTSLVGDIL